MCMQERLVSVVYGLLMQGKLHFLTALREGILTRLKTFVKEVSASCNRLVHAATGQCILQPASASCNWLVHAATGQCMLQPSPRLPSTHSLHALLQVVTHTFYRGQRSILHMCVGEHGDKTISTCTCYHSPV